MSSGAVASRAMLMLVRLPVGIRSMIRGRGRCRWKLMDVCVVGVIQDAKFKRREALADLAKAAAKK